ncbi:MAG: DUF3842 family protein [Firmicutes bacterium]|jgi:proline dehydrogenase|nr:DUF3842 family protein [Bacillota bacterium]
MKIAIIDGQGGGIGKSIIEKIKKISDKKFELIAIGTNSMATSNMMRAGAQRGATGENSVVIMSQKVDIIIGPLAVIMSNAMMGEITPKMAEAIGSSEAHKILIPINRCGVHIVGTEELSVNEMLEKVKEETEKYLKDFGGN